MDASPADGLRILVVDDSEAARVLSGVVLRTAGHEVDEVESGNAALARIRHHEYDLVVSDLIMPDGDGFEVLAALRGPDATGHYMPVVIVTTETDPIVLLALKDAGADAVLCKPFEPTELTEAVASVAAGARGGGPKDTIDVQTQVVMEAFPYPAVVLDADRHVIVGNHAFYRFTGAGISDRYACCNAVMHEDGLVPAACPLEEAMVVGEPCEAIIEEPAFGRMVVSVYPLETTDHQGRPLYLHMSRPVDAVA